MPLVRRRPVRRPRTTALLSVAAAAAVLAPVLQAGPSSASAGAPASGVRAAGGLSTAAYAYTAADTRMRRALTLRATTRAFGTAFGGAVVDVASNRVVWTKNGGSRLRPASTTKLVTATNALSTFGPAYRFTTTVRASTDGRTLWLVGSGDPSLSTTDVAALARDAAAAAKARGIAVVRVRVDDYAFARPTLASGWKSSYVPADARWVRALGIDGRRVSDSAKDAGNVFAAKLRGYGVSVSSVYRLKTAAGSPTVASVQGDRLDAVVRRMLLVSDNDDAELLHRAVARAVGQPGTWTGARTAQHTLLEREGISLGSSALYDGSGLSRGDRLTALQLARVVDNAFEVGNPELVSLTSGSLPLAGRTGTLSASARRYVTSPSSCAAGKVWAKTGTLSDAVALAGYTTGADGRLKAFAFLVGGDDSLTVKRRVDVLAATVNGCY